MYLLRELAFKDLVEINKWRNDPELIALLGAPYRFINIGVDEKWFDGYMNNRNSQVRCAIVSDESDDILGLVSLVDINNVNRSAVLNIMIGEKQNQGKGIGTFAVNAILKHAFDNMNLHRVELMVLDINKRAQHLYEKCGFVKEGTLRKSTFKDGKYVDMLLYSILEEEFHRI